MTAMRRIVSCAVIALIAIGSIFAGGNEEAGAVSVRVAMEAGPMADAATAVAESFTAENPEIQVEVVPMPYTTFQTQMTNVMAAGSDEFDAFQVPILQLGNYVANDWILPLDDLIARYETDVDDFFDSYWDVATLGGNARAVNPAGDVWALPFQGGAVLLVYRDDLVGTLGLTAPDSFAALQANVAAMTEHGIAGIALAGARSQNSHILWDLYTIAFGMGAPVPVVKEGDAYRVQMDVPAMREALTFYRDAVGNGQTPDGMREYRYSEKNTAIAQGIAGHTLQWMPAAYYDFENPDASAVAGQVGYAASPGTARGIIAPWNLVIAGNSDAPDATYRFLEYLSNSENNVRLALEFAIGPTRASAMADPALIAEFGTMAEAYADAAASSQPLIAGAPDLPIWQEILNEVNFAAYDAIFDGVPVGEALATMQANVEGVLETQGFTVVR